jgi:hypothetical protein
VKTKEDLLAEIKELKERIINYRRNGKNTEKMNRHLSKLVQRVHVMKKYANSQSSNILTENVENERSIMNKKIIAYQNQIIANKKSIEKISKELEKDLESVIRERLENAKAAYEEHNTELKKKIKAISDNFFLYEKKIRDKESVNQKLERARTNKKLYNNGKNEIFEDEYDALKDLSLLLTELAIDIEKQEEILKNKKNNENTSIMEEMFYSGKKIYLENCLLEQKKYEKIDRILEEKTRLKESKVAEIAELKELKNIAISKNMVSRVTELTNKIKVEQRKLDLINQDLRKEIAKYNSSRRKELKKS